MRGECRNHSLSTLAADFISLAGVDSTGFVHSYLSVVLALQGSRASSMSDRRLLNQLFASHARRVRSFFRRRVRDGSEVPDLTQEVFLRLLRVQDLKSISDPHGYLFTVAANLIKERAYIGNARRRESRLPIDEILDTPELAIESAAEDEIDTGTLISQLRTALRELPPRDREVLAMVYEEKLSYREIARRWGVSKTAVEKAVANATVRCRKQMEIEGPLYDK